jgi:uncharacterized glyoxalase superfamily protein PhnB
MIGFHAMLTNRSAPSNTTLSHVFYEDVAAAIEWLAAQFQFKEYYRYGPPDQPQGGQIRLGDACIQLATVRPGRATPAASRVATQMTTVFLDDVEAHYRHTKSSGAEIFEELNETMYGERQYGAIDLAGHRWLFSQHIRDTDPSEWGAMVTK